MLRKIVSIFFCALSLAGVSQSAKPFALDHVEWNILSCAWNSGPPYVYYFNHSRLCGDTIYQGNTYKRIFEGTASWYPPVGGMTPSKPYPMPASYNFYGFFRADSVLKRTYLRLPSWSSDSLLMDYNLHGGDTVTHGLYYRTEVNGPTPGPSPLKIVSEDSILVGTQKFRVLYTDSIGQLYNSSLAQGYFFIEGLGHINGVFEYWAAQEYYSHPFENCVGVDTVIFNCDCAHLAGVNEIPKEMELKIYPVPVENKLFFSMPVSGKIAVINSLGQSVFEKASSSCSELDIATLPKGIYLLEITSGPSISRKRVVKE